MPVMTVCASHSPLMYTQVTESKPGLHQSFFDAIGAVADDVRAFDPELVVVFGPDHFNALYYDLMPGFCVVGAAESSADWHQPTGSLRIPRDTALALTRALQADGFDPALSLRMRVDHGMTIGLQQIAGGYERFPVLPLYMNCAAEPRPSVRRSREFGAAVGRFFAAQGGRVLFIGSGGLSHDPPTARLATATPEQWARISARHEASPEEFARREARVIAVAESLARGERPILPPSEAWDRQFMDRLLGGPLEALDALTDEELDREAGFGGHEVRCWIAAFAATQEIAPARGRVDYYAVIPEWITGMGIVSARAA